MLAHRVHWPQRWIYQKGNEAEAPGCPHPLHRPCRCWEFLSVLGGQRKPGCNWEVFLHHHVSEGAHEKGAESSMLWSVVKSCVPVKGNTPCILPIIFLTSHHFLKGCQLYEAQALHPGSAPVDLYCILKSSEKLLIVAHTFTRQHLGRIYAQWNTTQPPKRMQSCAIYYKCGWT